MKTLLKHSNKIGLTVCCLLLLIPFSVSAEDGPRDKGKMDWKMDRIIQNEPEEDQGHTETELDKSFPELFTEETRDKIQSVQKERNESREELEDALFTMDLESEDTAKDTKESLFTSDYVAPRSSGNHDDESEDGNSWFNMVVIASLIGLGVIMVGGLYVMFRKMSD